MSERLDNDAVADRALDGLRRAAAGEVFLRDSQSESVEVKDGEVENVLARAERGIGVRVLERQRAGFAFTSDLSVTGVDACIDAARAMAAVTEPDPDLALASEPLSEVELGIHRNGARRPLDRRAEVAFGVERAARAVDPRISGFRKTTYSEGESLTIIATTDGARGAYRETHFGAGTAAIASDGAERQLGYHGEAARAFDGVSPEAVGRRAAEIAIGKLGARTFPTQTLSVVLDPWQGLELLGAIAPLFSADNVLKGKSLFAGRVGEGVASAKVTIVDDARFQGGLRSAPFDGEGVRTMTRTLVDRGTLRGYLTSLKTARKLATEPTGNARRGSYNGLSRIGPSNFYIAAGDEDASALVRGLDRALRITSLLNLHTIDPISGEFSLGASGDYLEHGDRAYPVQGITIAGNLTALLSSISGVGSDLTFGPSGTGSPTLVISGLSIGGTN